MSSNPPICSICIVDLLSTESQIASLKCGHVFHQWCIDEWINNKSACPICNTSTEKSSFRSLYFSSAYEQMDFWETKLRCIQDDLKAQLDYQTAQMCSFNEEANENQMRKLVVLLVNQLERQQEQHSKSREVIVEYISKEAASTSIERICLMYIIALLIWPQSLIVLTSIIVFVWFIIFKTIYTLQSQLNKVN
ncbi:hypothetical protein BD560DRAFT_427106 [Blakeslea trispora]|nr:hypothetical protein BD560DRAFT_427106 [Blakeslea trispora]